MAALERWTLAGLLDLADDPDPVTGCRLWRGRRHGAGYGAVRLNGADVTAHRVALALAGGLDRLPPADVLALHKCPHGADRLCVRPDHLSWGTPAENTADAIAAGTHVSVTHSNGRPRFTVGQLVLDLAGAS